MSLNTANTPDGRGVLIYNGEIILLYCKSVTLQFSGADGCGPAFKGKKQGTLYLTSHRFIFLNNTVDTFMSFAFPFCSVREVKLEQPIFTPNYLKGIVQPQPGGNFNSEIEWKMSFPSGGCIDFGYALLAATDRVANAAGGQPPPPCYAPPPGAFYSAPPAYYEQPVANCGGVQMPLHAFPDRPPANQVFMYDAPPPYAGLAQAAPVPSSELRQRSVPGASTSNGNNTAGASLPPYASVAPSAPNGHYDPAGPLPEKTKFD